MVKSKNYDSPFDKEELDNLERQPLLEEEVLSFPKRMKHMKGIKKLKV